MFDTKAHALQFARQVHLCIPCVEQETKLCAASHADVGGNATRRAGEVELTPRFTVNQLQDGHRNGDEDEESS